MPSLVEIQYNPYLPQVNILIDGRQPTSFSRLIQYTDEDIWKWANEILDAIYAEIKDDYNLCFIGNDFDAEIMCQLCQNDRHCMSFRKKDFIIADKTQSRLGKLNQLIKKSGVTSYDKTIIDAYFLVSPVLQQIIEKINSIDIKNLFCAVRTQMIEEKRNYNEDEKSILFIIVESMDRGYQYLADFSLMWPAYVVIIGNDTRISDVTKSGFFIETRQKDLFETLFKCFLQRPLIISFRNCISSIHGGNKITKELLRITSTEPVMNVSVDSEVEIGRSTKLSVLLEPNVGIKPKLLYRVRNQEIASCDGLNLYGLKEGTSTLEIYKQGSSKPLFTKEITVYRRNRITRLIFSDDSLLMGIGDNRQIQMDYYPNDADNRNEIVWKSSDEAIVSVNQNGNLLAKGSGKCRIICTAENVSSQCTCVVMPYMEDLIIESGDGKCIHMIPMQEMIVAYRSIPENCIDKKLTMFSSDNDVVNVVNNTLYAKNKGIAQVTIRNVSGRISRTLEVVVERHIQSEKKGGFFKRLFS
jgi:hypothetical protein